MGELRLRLFGLGSLSEYGVQAGCACQAIAPSPLMLQSLVSGRMKVWKEYQFVNLRSLDYIQVAPAPITSYQYRIIY